MPRFTAANAREMAARAHTARLQRLASGRLAGETFPQPPQVGLDEAAGSYVIKRLSRVRAHLDRIDALLAEESDPKRLKELAEASHKLAEQERVLDNRPLPGSRRPAPSSKSLTAPASSGPWLPADELQPAPPPG